MLIRQHDRKTLLMSFPKLPLKYYLRNRNKLILTRTSKMMNALMNCLLDSRSGELKGSDTYNSLTKKIQKHVRYLRNNRLLREAEQINSHATRRETEELFRLMKNNDSSFRSIKKTNKCEPEKLKENFSKHFNVAPPNNIPDELLEIPQYIKNLATGGSKC